MYYLKLLCNNIVFSKRFMMSFNTKGNVNIRHSSAMSCQIGYPFTSKRPNPNATGIILSTRRSIYKKYVKVSMPDRH